MLSVLDVYVLINKIIFSNSVSQSWLLSLQVFLRFQVRNDKTEHY